MELANPHPIPASLTVSELPGFSLRLALAFAKATFNIADGRAVLETQAPRKLLLADTPTPLGDLPRDDLPRADSVFEVVLLGQARAPGGVPVSPHERVHGGRLDAARSCRHGRPALGDGRSRGRARATPSPSPRCR